MARIGHASIDENKKIKGGKAGDQTGKEVCIREWYSKPWKAVLRAKSKNVAEDMARCCEYICNCNLVGYDQNQRNSLRSELARVGWKLDKMSNLCETDCSAFMSVCAEYAGVRMSEQYISGNAPTTSNMVNKFCKTGMFDVLTDVIYLKNTKELKRGDILVGAGHTAMYLDDAIVSNDKPVLRKGCKGSWVVKLQSGLVAKGYKLDVDGDFGEMTKQAVISYQGECGLVKDGIVGIRTWEKLER